MFIQVSYFKCVSVKHFYCKLFQWIDTREESEFAAGHIDNAQLLLRGALEFKLSTILELADKSKPVLIYCWANVVNVGLYQCFIACWWF